MKSSDDAHRTISLLKAVNFEQLPGESKNAYGNRKAIFFEQKNQLRALILKVPDNEVSVALSPLVDAPIPESVTIDQQMLDAAKGIVTKFNENDSGPITDASGSIHNKRSIHHLWKNIIKLVKPRENNNNINQKDSRVVYEWKIRHPLGATGDKRLKRLGFAFIPPDFAYLDWLDYSGGIELRLTPQLRRYAADDDDSPSEGTAGYMRALSHAAMCVYARWEKNNWGGDHVAFCCFADNHMFGIARVKMTAGVANLTVDVFGFSNLPGYVPDCGDVVVDGIAVVDKDDGTIVMRALKHILTSPAEDLTELMSLPISSSVSSSKSGSFLDKNGASETTITETEMTRRSWSLGSFVGAGAFAIVYSAAADTGASGATTTVVVTDVAAAATPAGAGAIAFSGGATATADASDKNADARSSGGDAPAEQCVIKAPILDNDRTKLAKERSNLELLTTRLRRLNSSPISSLSPSPSPSSLLQYFPQVVGTLVEISGGGPSGFPLEKPPLPLPLALKLSPRGLSLHKYLSAVNYNFTAVHTLLRLMGPVMVRALEAAHSVKIFHCDVRLPNILIVPPNELMQNIILELDDALSDQTNLIGLELDKCRFILNDWGESSSIAYEVEGKKKEEEEVSPSSFLLTEEQPVVTMKQGEEQHEEDNDDDGDDGDSHQQKKKKKEEAEDKEYKKKETYSRNDLHKLVDSLTSLCAAATTATTAATTAAAAAVSDPDLIVGKLKGGGRPVSIRDEVVAAAWSSRVVGDDTAKKLHTLADACNYDGIIATLREALGVKDPSSTSSRKRRR